MNTTAALPAMVTRSRFLVRNLNEIAALVSHPDYEMNANGVRLIEKHTAVEFRKQMLPAKGADFDAVVAWLVSKPVAR